MQQRRVALCVVVAALISCCIAVELFPFNPVADPEAVVISGNARFTILTDYIIRMEYSNSGRFEDRATLAFLNRRTKVPAFTKINSGGILTLNTSALSLQYRTGQQFSSSSLSVTTRMPSSAFTSWRYGQLDTGNLLGTIKSLDDLDVISLNCSLISNVIVNGESLHCEYGLISRDGWRVVNDSSNWGLTSVNASSSPEWWDSVNTDQEDLYFFGHGRNYTQALYEFTQLSNPIAMVPRYASGIWWSRWYNINNWNIHDIVGHYEKYDIPLDVYVLDMDWHTKQGWGGYEFDPRLFPIPKNTMDWLHLEKGIYTSANLHDDDGVRSSEPTYRQLADYLGYSRNSQNTIPFEICTRNSSYMIGLEDITMGAVYKAGIDVAWIDYQQGGTQGSCTGLVQNPTIMLSHVRGTDHVRRKENVRDVVLARWGGLGNHRYQVGFSGDVRSLDWADLAFQPYFSMTAANVGFGFWSHDLVGPWNNHELHTRWLQWGAVSAIFRTHDRGMASGGCANNDPNQCAIVEMWKLPTKYLDAARSALYLRETWIPVLYNGVRSAFETGLSSIRPLYYRYPEDDNSYAATPSGTSLSQYLFCGDDILISPITMPANTSNFMTPKTVWLPEGSWYEKTSGLVRTGGKNVLVSKNYDLTEIPIFVRAGVALPEIHFTQDNITGVAMRQYNPLVFTIYPGTSSGSGQVYEDDAHTLDYIRGAYVYTTLTYSKTSNSIQINIVSRGSGYNSFPNQRSIRVKVLNTLPARTVTVNNRRVSFMRDGQPGSGSYHYSAQDLCLVIDTPTGINTMNQVNIVVQLIDNVDDNVIAGLRGLFYHANMAKSAMDPTWSTPGANSVTGGNVSVVASMPKELDLIAEENTGDFVQALGMVRQLYKYAVAEVMAVRPKEAAGGKMHVSKEKERMMEMIKGGKVPKSKVNLLMMKMEAENDLGETALQRWSYAVALLESAN